MKDLYIKRLAPGDDIPYGLLYLADEHREAVADYLRRGECYVAKVGGETVGEYILLPTRPLTVELVNVAVAENRQGQGIGKQLVLDAIERVRKAGYVILEVRTGNAGIGQLALYQKCGFEMYGVDVDFIARHYPEPIFENGIPCRHMVCMRMHL